MARLRYNGLSTQLGASLTNVATTATLTAALTHSDGTAVPTLSGDDYFTLTILNADDTLAEVVHVTGYTSGSTTISAMTRGMEGTTAQAHASGVLVRHAPTVRDVVGNVLFDQGGSYPPRADDTGPAFFIGATDPGPDGLDIMLADDQWSDGSGTDLVADALAAHIADTVAAHAASAIAFTPAGTIAATDVQAAIEELGTEKAAIASPALTGNPTAPTATPGDADTTIATTAFVAAAITAGGGYTDENARDAIGTALVEGTGIDIVVSDGSDTITISATGGGGAVATDTIFDAKGDLPVGTGADAASRLAVGTNGQVLTADSAQATGTKWAAANPWATLINLPLTSLTDWTASGGTWDLTGSGSTMRDSAALAGALHMNIYGPPRVPIDHMVIECEIMVNSSNNTAASRAGFLFGEATNSGQVSLFCGVSGFTSAIDFEASGVTNYGTTALAANIAHGTWIKLRVHKSGSSFSVYVNDVLVSGADMTSMAASRRHRFALMTYAANASFRNLKVYVPATPA